jgi:hypothetical protein
MENENTDFELTNENIENWEKAEFWESDPMQDNSELCSIILYVNWEKKTATVETQMDTNTIDGAVWNGLASEYSIAEDTDFKQFPEFYKEKIQPLLQKIGEGFESEWDGSNWKGKFNDECGELNEKVDTLLREDTPKHDMIYYFSLRDSYETGGMSQLVDDLKSEGVDILTADLSDKDVMEKAVNAVTWNEGSDYKLVDVDVEDELKDIQRELQEEAAEDSE